MKYHLRGIDLDKISSLEEEASRRIYMSATLADDSVFVSALGLNTEEYLKMNVYKIMIHPSKVVDEVASPDENMRVMTEKELTCFRKNLRDFYSTLCQNGNLSDVNKINELLKIKIGRIYKLRKDDIVNRYTVKFERKD